MIPVPARRGGLACGTEVLDDAVARIAAALPPPVAPPDAAVRFAPDRPSAEASGAAGGGESGGLEDSL